MHRPIQTRLLHSPNQVTLSGLLSGLFMCLGVNNLPRAAGQRLWDLMFALAAVPQART